MVAEAIFAHALSRFGFKNWSTINWKSASEVQATINLNAWKVVGTNSAPSKIDLPIKLRDKLGTLFATGSCVETFEYSFITDETTSLNMVEDL
jgi:hypothetical protein